MSVAQIIIPIFLLILLGVAMRRWFGLREDFWPQLDRLIYYVFFPALLFNTLAHFEIDLRAATPMLIVATLFMCAGMRARLCREIPVPCAVQGVLGDLPDLVPLQQLCRPRDRRADCTGTRGSPRSVY